MLEAATVTGGEIQWFDSSAWSGAGEETAAPSASPGALRNRKVLVVEDNPAIRKVAEALLRPLACDVDAVGAGADALDALARRAYDVVLMDCQLPDMDGAETTRAIRGSERRGRRTVIVAMTGNAQPGERSRCLEAGMDDYLSKPIRRGQLAQMLERWAPAAKLAAEPAAQSPSGDPSRPARIDPRSLASLRALEVSSPGLVGEVVGHFLRSAPGQVLALKSAAEARDPKQLEREAHRLKGSCSLLGLTGMATVLQELESAGHAGELASLRPALDRLEGELDFARTVFEAELRS